MKEKEEVKIGGLCIDCNYFFFFKEKGANKKRCEECIKIEHRISARKYSKYVPYKENRFKYGEIIVLTSCIDCNELLIKKITGRPKLYCDSCLYTKDKEIRKGYNIVKICKMCNNKIERKNIGKSTKQFGKYCDKCKITHGKIYRKDYYSTFRDRLKSYSKKQHKNKKSIRFCLDCKLDITESHGHRIRCKPCQKEKERIIRKEYSKKYFRDNKWFLNIKHRNKLGTNLTNKNKMARKENGEPDWVEEELQIKELKSRIYKQYKHGLDDEIKIKPNDNFHG